MGGSLWDRGVEKLRRNTINQMSGDSPMENWDNNIDDLKKPEDPYQNYLEQFKSSDSGSANNSSSGSSKGSSKGGSRSSSKGSSKGSSRGSSKSSSKDDAAKAAKKAKREKEAREKKLRGGIHDRGKVIRGGIDSLIGHLPGQQNASRAKFLNQRDMSIGNVNNAMAQTQGRFDNLRSDVVDAQKGTLRDLASDVRNSFQAGNIYLGARGASNSSAAGMYSRGIQQAANRNRANVMNTTANNLSDLTLRNEEANAMATDQINKVNNWFDQSVADLEQAFNARKQELEMAKVNATADELAAINALDMQLMTDAQNRYNALQQQADFYHQQVSDAISGIQGGTGEIIDALGGRGREGYATPQAGPINSSLDIAPAGEQGMIQNPVVRKKWEDVDLGINAATPGSGFAPNAPIF